MGMFSGPWTWRRVKSFSYLALAFNARQLRRLFLGRRDDGGLSRFLENFSAEGMTPLDAAQTEHVLALTRCTYCGLCETACPLPLDRWPAFARALEHSRHAAADLPPSCPPECRQCEAICPTGVPLREIPAFVRRQ